MIAHEDLLKLISYEPETGLFRWLTTKGHVDIGQIAGTRHPNGYIRISIKKQFLYAHRLAWFYVHGEMPCGLIDHINGIKDDNRIANLRVGNKTLNAQNYKRPRKDNTSGYLGVCKCKKSSKWIAQIVINGKHKAIGRFKTAEEASNAYLMEKRKHHAFFVDLDNR
jgi:hypothetical protein